MQRDSEGKGRQKLGERESTNQHEKCWLKAIQHDGIFLGRSYGMIWKQSDG